MKCKISNVKWVLMGSVAVDSGTLMVADSCYLTGNDWSDADYKKEVCSNWKNFYKEIKFHNGLNKAIVFQTGLGDGYYKVYGKIGRVFIGKGKNKLDMGTRVTEVKIKLI